MGKKLIRSFTLLEILFVVVVVSIGLMAVLTAINYAFENVKSVKQRVIAINLAREGMEGVYQIRDTNRLFGPAKKDECRLDTDPLTDQDAFGCSDDDWMGSGNYILQKSGNQQYFYLSGGSDWQELDVSDGVQTSDRKFSLCLGSGDLRESCSTNYNGPLTYFRQIHGEGLYYKDSNTTGGDYLNCKNGNDFPSFDTSMNCGGSEAKEYRFCSQVVYIGQGKGKVEICGLITNFEK